MLVLLTHSMLTVQSYWMFSKDKKNYKEILMHPDLDLSVGPDSIGWVQVS